MVDPQEDPIELVSSRYETWREQFRAERDRIRAVFDDRGLDDGLHRVEHVGSTAVPGLAAKPIVDLDVVVDDDRVSEASRAIADELGGDRFENSPEWHPVFREADGQRFNDHVFAASSDGWRVSVATRDVLRERTELRAEYERLKRELAAEHDDLTEYSVGKSEFVERVLTVAREEFESTFDFEIPEP